jgi:two-component system, chemotaxis family, chemotaxis protein CheY
MPHLATARWSLEPDRWLVLGDALVLIVDPHPSTRASLAATLAGAGCSVLQAADGEQALELMRVAVAAGHPLDAVLLDVRSSSVDGWVSTRRLRAEPGGTRRELPLFVLGDSDTAYSRQLAELFGATGLIPMPCSSAALYAELDEAIGQARAERTARRLIAQPAWSSWETSRAA